jgi:hypothetical protein
MPGAKMSTAIVKRGLVVLLFLFLIGAASIMHFEFSGDPGLSAPLVRIGIPHPPPPPDTFDSGTHYPVFGHSVVKGGVHSLGELLKIMQTDALVAAHYKKFSVENAHIVELDHPMLAFVSYRIAGKGIYWTKSPRLIPSYEPLLSDGEHYIRARCGNMLESNPMVPTSESHEPTDLDTEAIIPPPASRDSGSPDESSAFVEVPPEENGPPNLPPNHEPPPPSPNLPPPVSSPPPGTGCIGCIPSGPIVPNSPNPPVTTVPEPDSFVLLALGIGSIPLMKAWTKRKARMIRRNSVKLL